MFCRTDVAPWMLDYAREHDLGMCTYDGLDFLCPTRMDRYLEREEKSTTSTRF